MTLIVPNVSEVKALELMLNRVLTLRLYSNDYVPVEATTIAAFTEVTGGGYAAVVLTGASWNIVSGDPSYGQYPLITFTFTGVVGGSGNIYGYYIEDPEGVCLLAERFDETRLPFTPIAGTVIDITPKFQAS